MLGNIKIPKNKVKELMKHIHQTAIKYLTYLILNKRELDNNQKLVDSLRPSHKSVHTGTSTQSTQTYLITPPLQLNTHLIYMKPVFTNEGSALT
jgi:hypothetical protein